MERLSTEVGKPVSIVTGSHPKTAGSRDLASSETSASQRSPRKVKSKLSLANAPADDNAR